MIDYHIHTKLCNHAKDTITAYIDNAIRAGLKEICFLEHLTIRPDPKISMSPDEIPLYFEAVQVMKYRYIKKIKIKIGLEVDFHPEYINLINDIVNRFAFDVIGGAVHFLSGLNIVGKKDANHYENTDINDLYAKYFEEIDKMLDFDYFDVVCHIDIIKKFGYTPKRTFEKEIDLILKKIKKKNLVLELNTNGYKQPIKEQYPSSWILKQCFEKGIDVTIGSDSHKSEDVGFYNDKALSLLHQIGYKDVIVFNKRKPSRFKIC
ncbi:MAG: histidinol-phosphatase HisJ family protein [Desulfobacterales bacterium]|nr:histidinol-phosphatase HisJ family protein [Desulfobacterales bacterium]